MQAYLALDHLAETMQVDLCDPNAVEDEDEDDGDVHFDNAGCMEGLSNRVNKYQLKDIDVCLHTAVMEYIYASQQEKEKAAAVLDVRVIPSTRC